MFYSKALILGSSIVALSSACKAARPSDPLVMQVRGEVREANANEFKSVAEIYVKSWFGEVIGVGTGNWVAHNQLLTAAHVVRNTSILKPVRSITIKTVGLPDVTVGVGANYDVPTLYQELMEKMKGVAKVDQRSVHTTLLQADYALVPCPENSVPAEYIAKFSKEPTKREAAITIVGFGYGTDGGPFGEQSGSGVKRIGTNQVWSMLSAEEGHGFEFKGYFGALLGAGDSGSSIFNSKGEIVGIGVMGESGMFGGQGDHSLSYAVNVHDSSVGAWLSEHLKVEFTPAEGGSASSDAVAESADKASAAADDLRADNDADRRPVADQRAKGMR